MKENINNNDSLIKKINKEIFSVFFKEYKNDLKMRKGFSGTNLIKLSYNSGKNKGVCTIIPKSDENKKYNEQDYPLILKGPGIMKIEQIYAKNINENLYFLLIMDESLSTLNNLNKKLHEDSYSLLKINNSPFIDIMGENLLKYFIKQLINLLEFVDRNNLYIKELSLNNFYISKKDFLIRLFDFKNIINLDDIEIPIEKKSIKEQFQINNKIKDKNLDQFDSLRKIFYINIAKCIYELMFGNYLIKKENESYVEEIEILIRYIKKIKAKNIDENLKELLICLMNFDTQYSPNIEEIYRNKWINQNCNIINDIISNFEKDIIKIISEFAKNDYLNKLESCFKENSDYKGKNINNINYKSTIHKKIHKKSNIIKTGRFTYKKRFKKS